ncbi:hypothetical protein HUW51_19075 [Adhaeribacter swui]|uniref:Lipoprotein n=1 Tax=Adhaeribacter swui TaxID=2086471 RepID=A0A7G7GC45_9BACT|nr:hypothetical protein [Adhaeribacter swui]QNF34729.1 hypothetical protein HUW51_19075 [Adhaeribacter swui]
MKNLILIFSIFLLACTPREKPLFKTLRIKHTYGDESYSVREMTFNLEENAVVGKITIPNSDKLFSSRTELNNKSISNLNSFVKLAENYSKNCEESNETSYVQYYEVEIDNRNLKIFKFCDWKSLTFQNLEKEIFESYFKEMPNKIKEFNASLSKRLVGKWMENEKLENLKLESEWILEKIPANSEAQEYFEFLQPQKAILNRKGEKIYYDYQFYIDNGVTNLVMNGDDKKNGEEFIYGQHFKVVELTNSQIKLVH